MDGSDGNIYRTGVIWRDTLDPDMFVLGSRDTDGTHTAWGQIHVDGIYCLFGESVAREAMQFTPGVPVEIKEILDGQR